jgi:hypothetical protein
MASAQEMQGACGIIHRGGSEIHGAYEIEEQLAVSCNGAWIRIWYKKMQKGTVSS